MTWWLFELAVAAPGDAAPADEGRAVYVAKCQSCHGPSGKGDGPAARALGRPPADLSDPTYWTTRTEADVRSVIAVGRPGTSMRGYPMPDDRLDALIAYLRTLSAG